MPPHSSDSLHAGSVIGVTSASVLANVAATWRLRTALDLHPLFTTAARHKVQCYQPIAEATLAPCSFLLLLQDPAIFCAISSYLTVLPALTSVLGKLDGTNALLLRDLDRKAELARILADVETLARDTLTALNRQAHGSEGRVIAAVRAMVYNMTDSLSKMTLNSVETLAIIGLAPLHLLLQEAYRLHGHAHALRFHSVMKALAELIATGDALSHDSPIPEQTQREFRAANQLVVIQKILLLAEHQLVHSIYATAHLLRAQVVTALTPVRMVHQLLAVNRTVKELMLTALQRPHLGTEYLRRGLWIQQRLPPDARRQATGASAAKSAFAIAIVNQHSLLPPTPD